MQKHSDKQDAPFSRPCGATENDAQKLHARRLLPVIVVRNIAHEVLCLYRHEDRMRDAYMPPVRGPTTTAGTDDALPGDQLPRDARELSQRADTPNPVQNGERSSDLDFDGPFPGAYAWQS